MSIDDETSAASRAQDVGDPVRESDLERVLKDVPRGALAISVLAVALLLVAWLAVYFGVYLARGPVS